MESIIQTIKNRKSWRTFDERQIPGEKKVQINFFLSGPHETPFGTKTRFILIDIKDQDAETVKHLGTYGTIEGASLFIAGASEITESRYVDFGYAMEKIILMVEKLGLNTCWMGVTFDKAGFSEKMGLKEGEELIACTPVGYAKQKRRLKDLAMRKFVSSDSRLGPDKLFFDCGFDRPLDMETAGEYLPALECVRFAPSASNRQPWRIIRHNDKKTFSLFLEYTKGYQYKYGQQIDMGIAMLHFELACREMNISGRWTKESITPFDAADREYIATWK